MATDVQFVQFVADQINNSEFVEYKKMFGEYVLYYKKKVVALICDNQLFIKPTEKGRAFIKNPVEKPPYPGAKQYFLIEGKIEDRDWLSELIELTEPELKEPVKKKRKKRPPDS